MKRATSVLVIGSANTDMSVKLEHLPKPGETVLGGKFACAAGGKGANQAVSAARAGADVTLIARLGRDAFGDQALAGFAADGINVDHIVRDRTEPSGVALILIDSKGENSIAVAPGANARLTPGDLRKGSAAFAHAGLVVLQLEIPLATVEAATALAIDADARVVLNPAPAQKLPASLLRQIFVLTPNETETELLTGVKLTDDAAVVVAAEKLLAVGVQNVVITLGARGVFVADSGNGHWVEGFKMDAIDTTAAGDVFNGALAAALAEGKTLQDAAHFANAAAAISVTRRGAQPSAPTRAEIEQMLATRGSPTPVRAVRRNGHAVPAWKRAARIQA